MQCRTHPTKTAASTCNHCASWICDDCTVEVQGRLFCRPCLAVLSQAPDTHAPTPPPSPAPGAPPPPCGKISSGLLFFFSLCFPPGANYMYMGLMKRGLAAMCGFFLLIFVAIGSSMPLALLLWLAVPVFYISSFFDGFNVRRRINAGEVVRDDVGDALNGVIGNRFLRTLVLVVIAIVLIVNVVGFASAVISRLFVPLVIVFVLYIILKKKPPTA